MCCHSIALTDMRVLDAIIATTVDEDRSLRCSLGLRSAGDDPRATTPRHPSNHAPLYTFRAGHSPALLTVSQKDICHAR